jgi:hypothetical protein
MELTERIDYHGALTSQMRGHALRVVYAASGTLPAAAVLRDPGGRSGAQALLGRGGVRR